MDDKFFKSVARAQNAFRRLHKESGVIAVTADYVHVSQECMAEIATVAEIAICDDRGDPYPYGAQAIVNGVKFISVGTYVEFLDADLFALSVRSWEPVEPGKGE